MSKSKQVLALVAMVVSISLSLGAAQVPDVYAENSDSAVALLVAAGSASEAVGEPGAAMTGPVSPETGAEIGDVAIGDDQEFGVSDGDEVISSQADDPVSAPEPGDIPLEGIGEQDWVCCVAQYTGCYVEIGYCDPGDQKIECPCPLVGK